MLETWSIRHTLDAFASGVQPVASAGLGDLDPELVRVALAAWADTAPVEIAERVHLALSDGHEWPPGDPLESILRVLGAGAEPTAADDTDLDAVSSDAAVSGLVSDGRFGDGAVALDVDTDVVADTDADMDAPDWDEPADAPVTGVGDPDGLTDDALDLHLAPPPGVGHDGNGAFDLTGDLDPADDGFDDSLDG